MINQFKEFWKAKKFEHEWGFMANSGSTRRGDLLYCDLCKQWAYGDDMKPFKMSTAQYYQLHEEGKIDASEVLGPRVEKSFKELYIGHPFNKADDDLEWITVRGAHIPIKPGQSKTEAVNEKINGNKSGEKKPTNGGESKKPELSSSKENRNNTSNRFPDVKLGDSTLAIPTDNPEMMQLIDYPEGGGHKIIGLINQEEYERKLKEKKERDKQKKKIDDTPHRFTSEDTKWLEENARGTAMGGGRKEYLAKEYDRQLEICKCLIPSLGRNESLKIYNAIRTYQTSFYGRMNNSLRSGKIPKSTELLDKYMKLGPKDKSDVLYKGISKDYFETLSKLKPGKTFSDKAFISTSRDEKVASGFGKRKIQIIRDTKDKGVLMPDDFEKETLLPRDSRFKIISINSDKVIVKLISS